nr:hypothetical protein [Candidatus Gracilibacteria bacterium]
MIIDKMISFFGGLSGKNIYENNSENAKNIKEIKIFITIPNSEISIREKRYAKAPSIEDIKAFL